MNDFNELMQKIGNFFVDNWIMILVAIAILIIGSILIKLLSKGGHGHRLRHQNR